MPKKTYGVLSKRDSAKHTQRQRKRPERRSNQTPVEERAQQPQPERHGHRKNEGKSHIHGRRKATKSPERTLFPVQSKGAHRQILFPEKHTSRRSIHVQHSSSHRPNSRTCERCTKSSSSHRHPPRGK